MGRLITIRTDGDDGDGIGILEPRGPTGWPLVELLAVGVYAGALELWIGPDAEDGANRPHREC